MNVSRLFHCLLIALLVVLVGCSTAPKPQKTTLPPPQEPAKADAQAQLAPPAPPPPVMELSYHSPSNMRSPARQRLAGNVIAPPHWPRPAPANREKYTHYDDNPIHLSAKHPISTFGIDVDTASYTNVRRMLEQGRLPPAAAVRAEEFINYFDYGYPLPDNRKAPFSVTTEVAPAPWNPDRQLLLIGIQGYQVPVDELPDANLVFLVDTSGSMRPQDKLPLLKASLKQLVPQLDEHDHVAIVAYAGNAGVVLPSTPGNEHARILAAIDSLHAGGSTNGQAGLELAYAQARQGYTKDGINRVILATDGDFNVGQTSIEALKDNIADKRRSGIALTTLGFGQGNYNDAMAVALADIGNGNHYYIDKLSEGRRVLAGELSSTLLTIAKDVKIQIEFNPAKVQSWRLIGYVKRKLRREDFNNDRVDSGDLGAGANVTALYEITPVGSVDAPMDPLRYGAGKATATEHQGNELAFLRLRYKLPGQSHSRLIERPVTMADVHGQASQRLRFAAAVAAFAQALRGGKYLDGYTLGKIAKLASDARGDDREGSRAGLVRLVELADSLRTPVPLAKSHGDQR